MNAKLFALTAAIVATQAGAFTANDQTELECFTHWKPGETEVHPYSGRYYALIFSAVPGSDAVRQVNGYVFNPIGDIVPVSGTELTFGGRRLISLDGLLRQHTQPWLQPPEPFYHVLRHIEIPVGATEGWVETANDNNFYRPTLKDTGEPVPRGNDGVGLFPIGRLPCDDLPPVGGAQ